MSVWWALIALGLATIVIKAVGTVALSHWQPHKRAQQVLALVAPVVLAALVAVQVFTTAQRYQVDAKLIGLATATIALLLRAPLLVVVICAVAATALARALSG